MQLPSSRRRCADGNHERERSGTQMTAEAQARRRAVKRARVKRREEDARAVADEQRRDKYRTAFDHVQRAVAGLEDDGPLGDAVGAILAAVRRGVDALRPTPTQPEGASR